MKTNVEQLEEKNTVMLKVEVSEEEFNKALDQAYKSISSKLVIPGFRKGKVPRAIINQRIGKEAVMEEAMQKALPGYYIEALKDSEIQPVDQPEVDIVQLEEGKPFVFTAKVKVKPEVKLGDFKSVLEVERPSDIPTEEDINNQIDNLRNNFASLDLVEGRAVQDGDFALIDFEGFLGDEPFEGGSAEDYLLEIGSGTFVPGFEEQIIGMNKGDEKEITITFPEDYGNDQLAGKETKFKVKLKEIKEKKLPNVDDEFAKQVGFDTVDELREDVKGKIADVKKKYADAKVRSELVDKVTSAAELEIHDVMVEQELDDMLEDYASDLVRQGFATMMPPSEGTPFVPEDLRMADPYRTALNNYLAITGTTVETLREQWRKKAENTVRSRLVLEQIAKTEGIEVSPEEIDNEIKKAAEAANRTVEDVKRIFMERGTLDILKQRMTIDKVIDWLVENARITQLDETVKTDEEAVSEETTEDKKDS